MPELLLPCAIAGARSARCVPALALVLALPAAMLACGAPAARADGTFAQIDFADSGISAVAVAARGNWSYGLSRNQYVGGYDWTASVLYRMQFGTGFPVGVQVGPALRTDADHDTDGGLRLTLDHWQQTDWGHVYLLGDYVSVRNSHFAMVQLGHAATGLGLELATMGDDADYQEETAALTYRFGQSPVSLRLGYKMEAEEVFLGLSVNTF